MKFDEFEKAYWKDLYLKSKGDVELMVKESGISRSTIYRKMKMYFSDFRYHLKETK